MSMGSKVLNRLRWRNLFSKAKNGNTFLFSMKYHHKMYIQSWTNEHLSFCGVQHIGSQMVNDCNGENVKKSSSW